MKSKKLSEHQEQVLVVSWFKRQYLSYEGCIIAIPNGTHIAGDDRVRAMKMRKMKKEGFKSGVSDLFITVPVGAKNGYAGLWIEMKAKGKTLSSVSEAQMGHLILMRTMGYRAEWAAGFDAAKVIIENYRGEL